MPTTWWRAPTVSIRLTGLPARPLPVSASARVTWPNGMSPSTGGGRSRSRSSPHATARRPRRSAPGELCRRLSDPVDDRLALAGGLVQPARLRVPIDHQWPKVDADQPRAVEGIAADHPLAGLLRPHLVEDEVAVGVGDQVILVDLNRLHPVRVIPDDQVGAVVDRQVADLAGGIRGNPGPGHRQEFAHFAPEEGDHHAIGLRSNQIELAPQTRALETC